MPAKRYLVKLTIDQRPSRTEWVSEGAYLRMIRLGWFERGLAALLDS